METEEEEEENFLDNCETEESETDSQLDKKEKEEEKFRQMKKELQNKVKEDTERNDI